MSVRSEPAPVAVPWFVEDDRVPTSPAAAQAASTPGAEPEPAEADWLYLAGQPSLRGFVHHVHSHAARSVDKASLVEEWQAARARLTSLERREAGIADHPVIANLGPSYEPLLAEFFRNPLVRRSFNTLPTDIALVPLDSLVVYQRHIDLAHVRRLRERYPAQLEEADVFRICLPPEPSRPPVTWSGTRRGQFVFLSESNDLRSLGAVALRPEQLAGSESRGTLVGLVGLAVGFGSNFLNAFHAAGRLILNNGSHRAYALREAGVTHVPCVIQQIAGLEELNLVAPLEIRRRRSLYLEHRRPPMLKDYLDPRLRTVVPSRRRLRQITVRFKVEQTSVPALDDPRKASL